MGQLTVAGNGNLSNAVRDEYGTIPLISQRRASQLGNFPLPVLPPSSLPTKLSRMQSVV
jgi:hypothetical protein